MIEFQGASRWYGQVIGLNDVTCHIDKGVTALIGPNGAGKSTFIKLVSGQLRPTTGSVTVLGQSPFANQEVFRRLGICPEVDSFYEEMTGQEFVTFLATLGGLTGARRSSRVSEVIQFVGMEANAGRRIGGYSKGMRQRIKLAQALVHDPDVLLLDEPLNGLDPVGRREVTDLVKSLGEAGKCVVISSHILYEIEHMTRRILLINRGRLLAQGDLYEIRGLIDRHPHRISLESDQPRRLAAKLMELDGVVSSRLEPISGAVEIETRDPDGFYRRLPEIVAAGPFDIRSFASPDNNLEAVFRYLTE